MKLTIQYFWEGEATPNVAPFLTPLTLDLLIEKARELAIKNANHENVPAHSFTIKSEDGTILSDGFTWMACGGGRMSPRETCCDPSTAPLRVVHCAARKMRGRYHATNI